MVIDDSYRIIVFQVYRNILYLLKYDESEDPTKAKFLLLLYGRKYLPLIGSAIVYIRLRFRILSSI